MNAPAHNPSRAAGEPRALVFRARHRLSRDRDYQRVLGARARKPHGALIVFAAPNTLGHHRLGLSVGRRVGNAVKRNRIKRLLRDVFRHAQSTIPMQANGAGYDFVIQIRPHDTLHISEYADSFQHATTALHTLWNKRLHTGDHP